MCDVTEVLVEKKNFVNALSVGKKIFRGAVRRENFVITGSLGEKNCCQLLKKISVGKSLPT